MGWGVVLGLCREAVRYRVVERGVGVGKGMKEVESGMGNGVIGGERRRGWSEERLVHAFV